MNKKASEPGRLSEAEAEVMREVWGLAAPVTVSRMLEVFSARRGWKTSTLSTIMDRLIEKGFMTKTLNGKTNVYFAALSEAEHREYETRAFLKSMHNGSVKSFIAALADGGSVSEAELAEIRDWFMEKAAEKR